MGLYAYGKIGRAVALRSEDWGVVGGDMEPPRLLHSLAVRHPEHQFLIISTCRDDPQECGYPSNVINTWTPDRLAWYKAAVKPYQEIMRQVSKTDPAMLDAIRGIESVIDSLLTPLASVLDGIIVWAGQHGTANSVLPAVTERSGIPGFTRPYDSFVFYGGGIFRLINVWRDLDPIAHEEVWLIADARNHLKARDQKWPLRYPVLGQFNFTRNLHHERFGDPRDTETTPHGWGSKWKTDHTWESPIRYVYSGLEACSVLPEYIGSHFDDRDYYARNHFGLFINEAGFHVGQGKDQEASGRLARAPILREWVLPLSPAFIHGKWTAASCKSLGVDIAPASFEDFFPTFRSVKSTFTTPSSGSGWATTKPWEAFAAGVACFRHPAYDTQDHIYGQLPDWCMKWLSPQTPEDLAARVHALNTDEATWRAIVGEQYRLYQRNCEEKPWVQMIEKRLGI